MFQLWQEPINGRNCKFKLTRDPELIPWCVGISLHMAPSAKHWPETFCEHGQNSASSARSTSPDPNFGPCSLPLVIISQSPDLELVQIWAQPAPFQAGPFFPQCLFMSLGEFGSPLLSLCGPGFSNAFSTLSCTDQSLPDTHEKFHGDL